MLKSRLFKYILLIGLVATEASARNEVTRAGVLENKMEDLILKRVYHVIVQRISEAIFEARMDVGEGQEEGSMLKRVEHVVVEGINKVMNKARSIIFERIPEPTPAPAPAPVVLMPRTTPAPRISRRQAKYTLNILHPRSTCQPRSYPLAKSP